MTEHVLYEQVRDLGFRPPIQKLNQRYPQSLLVLIQEMWQKEPSKVATIHEHSGRAARTVSRIDTYLKREKKEILFRTSMALTWPYLKYTITDIASYACTYIAEVAGIELRRLQSTWIKLASKSYWHLVSNHFRIVTEVGIGKKFLRASTVLHQPSAEAILKAKESNQAWPVR
ncbi:hypothetical protein BC936DRAFT_138418 [Jimgerdemannia flammicorona]|uniref:Uncharacterized protein n=1 Tax=Jimgerdemannia flammicorona TaxID=994334 RepID=A0A433DIH4_9FUNG|nr:hypothetical protein BC936DRAFT_138418 [Jimgerdemannia flammicorona]